jgi:hypothetical protein
MVGGNEAVCWLLSDAFDDLAGDTSRAITSYRYTTMEMALCSAFSGQKFGIFHNGRLL